MYFWLWNVWNNKSCLTKQNHDLSVCNLYNLSGYIIVLYSEAWVSKWYIILKYPLFTSQPHAAKNVQFIIPCNILHDAVSSKCTLSRVKRYAAFHVTFWSSHFIPALSLANTEGGLTLFFLGKNTCNYSFI